MSARRPSFQLSHHLQVFLATLVLGAVGLLFVFEASVGESFTTFGHPYHFITKQTMWFGVGFCALVASYLTPLTFWQKTAWIWYSLGILGLILVFIPGIGRELNGAHRWIFIGGTSFQPIELVKLSLVLFFPSWLIKHQRLEPFIFLTLIPAALVLKQPDMGSMLIVLSIAFGLFFTAGSNLKQVGLITGVAVGLLIIAIALAPYRLKRVATYFNPESDPTGSSFHIRQITFALGNGGWFGQGIGKSRQKFSYIPEVSTDSIFAVIAEEVGFVGSLVVLSLFGWFAFNTYKIVVTTEPNSYPQLVAIGIFTWIISQVIINLAAVVALVPLTGIPLPFISYGGSSLVTVLFATGILLRIGKAHTNK